MILIACLILFAVIIVAMIASTDNLGTIPNEHINKKDKR